MGKRTLIVLVAALVIVFACVGAAAAAGGIGSPDETGTTPSAFSDVTVSSTEGSGSQEGDEQTPTTVGPQEPGVDEGDGVSDEAGDLNEDKGAAPANFGQTISALRAAGDHTPAAVIKGKKVPGYYKKIAAGSTTTTAVAAE